MIINSFLHQLTENELRHEETQPYGNHLLPVYNGGEWGYDKVCEKFID